LTRPVKHLKQLDDALGELGIPGGSVRLDTIESKINDLDLEVGALRNADALTPLQRMRCHMVATMRGRGSPRALRQRTVRRLEASLLTPLLLGRKMIEANIHRRCVPRVWADPLN
jgi:hypothetical protein